MLFQGMFFIITPGADLRGVRRADEVQHDGGVHDPLGHAGLLPVVPLGLGRRHSCLWQPARQGHFAGGALDFAGGTVVHISSGVSALICALLLGKRLGYGSEPMPPHNLTYTAIGATMLWVGWFGFNAGSALNASGLAASAFAATHFAAAAGGLTWAAMEWIIRGKPTHPGRLLRRRGRPGLHYAGLRLCHADARPVMGVAVGIVCYLACTVAQVAIRVRRFAGRLRRPRRGRHAGRHPDRRLRHPGHRRRHRRAQAAWACSKAARC